MHYRCDIFFSFSSGRQPSARANSCQQGFECISLTRPIFRQEQEVGFGNKTTVSQIQPFTKSLWHSNSKCNTNHQFDPPVWHATNIPIPPVMFTCWVCDSLDSFVLAGGEGSEGHCWWQATREDHGYRGFLYHSVTHAPFLNSCIIFIHGWSFTVSWWLSLKKSHFCT